MTDPQLLYAAICAHPDEDTPRLALADFLEEEDGIENRFRADIIRTHCRFAREEPWSKPWRELREHWLELHNTVIELDAKGQVPWLAHLKGRTKAWELERGLVGHLTLFSKRFVNEGNSYFEQDPVRSVKFVKLSSSMGTVKPEVLFACPHLARIAKLDFDGSRLKDGDITKLAASPHIKGVRWLGLGGYNPVSKSAMSKLLKAMPVLTELSFSANTQFGNGHAIALSKCPEFARVTALDLTRCGVNAEGVAALVSGKHAGALTALQLMSPLVFDNELGTDVAHSDRADGVKLVNTLASSSSLGQLRELDLSYRDIGSDGLKLLVAAKSLPALRELNLESCGLTLAAVTELAKSALGARLLRVNFQSNAHLNRHADKLAAMFPGAYVEEPFQHVS